MSDELKWDVYKTTEGIGAWTFENIAFIIGVAFLVCLAWQLFNDWKNK